MIIGCVVILGKMIPKVRFRVCPLSEIAERMFSFRCEFLYGANKKFPSVFIKMPPKRKLIYFKKNLENEWAKVNDVFL